jgi:hypothetical protein
MQHNLGKNTKPRKSLCFGLFLCLDFLACSAYAQKISEAQCDAGVIAVKGTWVANPGGRSLTNWSCLNGGDEIALAEGSQSGSITVIYHRGAKQPHTVTCRSRAECRNAYRVEQPPAQVDIPQSLKDRILDLFFSIFNGGSQSLVVEFSKDLWLHSRR